GPAAGQVVVAAQVVAHQSEGSAQVGVGGALVHIAPVGVDGEEAGGLHGLGAHGLVVTHEVDEGLGGLDLGLVALVEHAEAVGAGHLQLGLAVVRGECHGEGGELGLLSVLSVVGVVPAEGDGAGLVGEGLQLVSGSVAGVGGQGALVHHLLQQSQGLHVVGAVGVVGGAVVIHVVVGVQVVHQSAGALVAALGAAVDDAGGGQRDGAVVDGGLDGLHGGHEVVGGPGAGLLVDVLEGAGG